MKHSLWIVITMALVSVYCIQAVAHITLASTPFTCMWLHTSWLHVILNVWCMYLMRRNITLYRTMEACALTTIVSLFFFHTPARGFSWVLCYYIGRMMLYMTPVDRLMILACNLVGIFLPGIAAIEHLVMLALGLFVEFFKRRWNKGW